MKLCMYIISYPSHIPLLKQFGGVLYSEMRLSYLSISFGNGIYLILSSGSKCFEMETKHLLVELFSWLQNPNTSLKIPQFPLAGSISRLLMITNCHNTFKATYNKNNTMENVRAKMTDCT